MPKHTTVQKNQTNRPTSTPHSGQTTSTGHVTTIPIPARSPRLNDKATSGGAGNLGPAGGPAPTGPLGGGPAGGGDGGDGG